MQESKDVLKQVFQPYSDFTENGKVYATSQRKHTGAMKSGTNEEFILKKGLGIDCVHEKLCYDLLALCGVKVPETYVIHREKGDGQYWLASRKEKGYQDLGVFLLRVAQKTDQSGKLKIDFPKAEPWLRKQSLPGKDGLPKPIQGLYENVAVFMFLQDRDVIGHGSANLGLIEQDNCFQTVKIDPANSDIERAKDDHLNNKALEILRGESKGHYISNNKFDRGTSELVFKHCTSVQINDGMIRVARLTDAQLKSVIYNEQFPDYLLPAVTRNAIFATLTARRDSYIQVLDNKNIDWKNCKLISDHIATATLTAHGPIFWFKANKCKVAAVVAGAIPGAVLGAEKEFFFDPGMYNGLALAGIGVGLVVLLLAMKYGVDKCRTNNHEHLLCRS